MIIISELSKLNEENFHQYIWRLDGLIQSGKYQNWKEITPIVNKELFGDDESQFRDESAYRKAAKYARDFKEAGVFDSDFDDDAYMSELKLQKRELEKERKKLQTEKLEYNKWLREDARDELIVEKICESVSTLPSLDIPKKIELSHNTRGYALCVGDEHFGVEYELKDLFGNVINAYSPEIFEQRMWLLFAKVIETIKKENIDVLNIFSMGDFNDGILRASQLQKLRYGVVEQTIKYADFMANWLNELSKYVVIKFQMVNGNHSELRMISQPKGTFVDDNMGFVVLEFLKTRLKDNPNIKVIENPTGLIYAQICTYPVLCIHGEVKNMERALKDFSITYGVPISYLFAGHLHHSRSEDIGIDCAVYNVPSVIGVDSYSLSLNKTSNAGAKLFVFEQAQGITTEYNFKLN